MNRPTRRDIIYRCKPAKDYDAEEADTYMDHLESELTQLRTERDRLREAWSEYVVFMREKYGQHFKWTCPHLAKIDAALTRREPRGQQIWPPVVDSATDSREGGTDADDR